MVGHMADDVLKFRAGDLKTLVMERAAERDTSVSQYLRDAVEAYDPPCSSCGECSVCGGEVLELDTPEDGQQATIVGYGRWSETSNPEVQALIDRAKELLAEGAVGVSVATDLDPADLPSNPDDVTEDHIMSAHQRNRHVAIVDTPAFSGAFLDEAQDGTLSGPLVFEGSITGDIRSIGPVGTMNLDDETTLPFPIIFDLHEGDHTGTVVGYIDRLERVDGIVGAGTAPLVASLNVDSYPAYLFSEPEATAMTVHAPDKDGYRRYTGIIADANVCHKGRPGGCYRYQAADLGYFHSGARIPLDDGTFTRVGPLMFGDMHADGTIMDYSEALERTNEDARTVFAMGKCFHHRKGLLFSGVLMPDADIMRIQATAPSIEQWPDHRGKLELKTALQVPRPALPVAASLTGGGVQLTEASEVIVNEAQGDWFTRMDDLLKRMDRLETTTAELLSAHMQNEL